MIGVDSILQNTSEAARKIKQQQLHHPILPLSMTAIDFGFQSVGQESHRSLTLSNVNHYDVEWQLQSSDIFTVSPSSGVLTPNSRVQVLIHFLPSEASAVVSTMVLTTAYQTQAHVIKISGIGKYPFIRVQQTKTLFENLLVGRTKTKEITIANMSQVSTKFSIVRISTSASKSEQSTTTTASTTPQVFSLNVKEGVIPSESTFLIKITFAPTIVGMTSISHWEVRVPGSSTSARFTAIGSAEGFSVRLSESSINFNEVKIDAIKNESRLLTIHNDSELPTKFQFYADSTGVFSFSKTKGTVKAKSYARIAITFVPRHTICYYQRVFCAVSNHALLYVDLLATCYDLLFKPLPICQSHINSFRARVTQGRLSLVDFKYIENSLLLKISKEHSPQTKRNTAMLKSSYQQQLSNSEVKSNNLAKSLVLRQSASQQNGILKSSLQKSAVLLKKSDLHSKRNVPDSSSSQLQQNIRSKNIFAQSPMNSQLAVSSGDLQYTKKLNLPQSPAAAVNIYDNQFDQVTVSEDGINAAVQPNQIQLHRELFLKQTSEDRLIRTSVELLDFNFQEFMTLSTEKSFTVCNSMNSSITIFWTKPMGLNPAVESSMQIFNVTPETATLKPNVPVTFTVTFRPSKISAYYFQELQFIAYKYTERLTKAVADEFKQSIMLLSSQSQLLTQPDNQQALTHNASQLSFMKPMNLTASRKKQQINDYLADETFPPFSGSISCVGHSFGPHSLVFIPMAEFYPSNQVHFKPCRSGEVSYASVELRNSGDTPIFFRIQRDEQDVYTVFPQFGSIAAQQFVLVMVQFRPKEAKSYDAQLNVVLNHNSGSPMKLALHGVCSEPIVSFENEGKVYFPEVAVGVFSKQNMRIQNNSKIDLQFEIAVPEKYKDECSFEPTAGIIKQSEYLTVSCGFVPYARKSYKIKPIFKAKEILDLTQSMVGYFLPGSGNDDMFEQTRVREQESVKRIEKQLTVLARGGDGSISIKPEVVDFGIVKVNFSERITATLHNDSSCTFFVQIQLVPDTDKDDEVLEDSRDARSSSGKSDLEQDQAISGNERRKVHMMKSMMDEVDESNQDNNTRSRNSRERETDLDVINKNFSLDFTEGVLPANSKIELGITFSPTQINAFGLKLIVVATEKNPNASVQRQKEKVIVQKTQLKIKANGNYPLLKIIDVRNDAVSVASLWENFQINKINEELATDLNEYEINFLRIEQLNIEQAQRLQAQLKNYTWNFGYLPNNKNVKPRKIVVTIQNVGGTELDFDFKLPSDSQVDVEPWADPGELQGDEAYEKAIVDRKIFQILPKSGTLKPQQLQDIELIYSPGNIEDGFQIMSSPAFKQEKIQSESHLLRVVLQINNGKPLVLNLKGMTLSPTEGMLSVKQNNVRLPDCPIGMLLPLTYPIEIQNVGLTKLNYNIEVQEIDAQGQNIDSQFQIFQIANRTGSLLPNEKQYLYCLFKPLEVKNYYHVLTLKATDFMKPLKDIRLHISGQGYSKQPSKKPLKLANNNEYPQQRSSVSSIGSKVCFSIEEIDFGKLSPGQTVHRIIILYNLSTDQKLSFDFTKAFSSHSKAPGLVCDDKFTIEPNKGKLEPTEFIELKLTLEQAPQPSVYAGEIECAITWGANFDPRDNKLGTMSTISSQSMAQLERETLFLRIKKESKLDVKYAELTDDSTKSGQSPLIKEHLMVAVIGQVIQEVLNDDTVFACLQRLNDQPIALFASFDSEPPASIKSIQKGIDDISDPGLLDEAAVDNPLFLNNENSPEDEVSGIQDQQSVHNTSYRSDSKPTRQQQQQQHRRVSQGKSSNYGGSNGMADFRREFLSDEFTDLVDLIMENTFFNIIQEATRKESDLLRIPKTFVQPQ